MNYLALMALLFVGSIEGFDYRGTDTVVQWSSSTEINEVNEMPSLMTKGN